MTLGRVDGIFVPLSKVNGKIFAKPRSTSMEKTFSWAAVKLPFKAYAQLGRGKCVFKRSKGYAAISLSAISFVLISPIWSKWVLIDSSAKSRSMGVTFCAASS